MESRNVVVCDNGTGVSSPLSLSSPSLRSISFLDPPSDLSMRRISGRASRVAPCRDRRCFGHRLGGRFASRWTRGGGLSGSMTSRIMGSIPSRGQRLTDFKVDDPFSNLTPLTAVCEVWLCRRELPYVCVSLCCWKATASL